MSVLKELIRRKILNGEKGEIEESNFLAELSSFSFISFPLFHPI